MSTYKLVACMLAITLCVHAQDCCFPQPYCCESNSNKQIIAAAVVAAAIGAAAGAGAGYAASNKHCCHKPVLKVKDFDEGTLEFTAIGVISNKNSVSLQARFYVADPRGYVIESSDVTFIPAFPNFADFTPSVTFTNPVFGTYIIGSQVESITGASFDYSLVDAKFEHLEGIWTAKGSFPVTTDLTLSLPAAPASGVPVTQVESNVPYVFDSKNVGR